MMVRKFKKLALVGLSLGLALGASQADAATTFGVQSAAIDPAAGSLVGTVHNNQPLVNENAQIGRLLLTGTDSNGNAFSFDSFCVDIFDNLSAPATFAPDTLSSLGLSTAKNNQLTKLLANVDSFIAAGTSANDKAERSAAAQMAIWEIVNETTGTMDVNGADDGTNSTANTRGSFYVANLQDPVAGTSLSEAATLISNVSSGGIWYNSAGTKVALVRSQGNQTQIVYGNNALSVLSAIPEPASWGLMVIGFGAIGGALRRKQGVSHAIA